ncbi:MAG: hypothetical protein CM1200mP34_4630 [Verrucomicrobiales bacterium]|nr:MAG: hypothetical protein CM1200mP34_4630 [Verrucomicrobiales bacterium]
MVESLTDASQLPNYSPPEEADPKAKRDWTIRAWPRRSAS